MFYVISTTLFRFRWISFLYIFEILFENMREGSFAYSRQIAVYRASSGKERSLRFFIQVQGEAMLQNKSRP